MHARRQDLQTRLPESARKDAHRAVPPLPAVSLARLARLLCVSGGPWDGVFTVVGRGFQSGSEVAVRTPF